MSGHLPDARKMVESATLLRRYNDWRRDLHDDEQIEMPHPYAVGQAIDDAIDAIQALAALRARAESAESEVARVHALLKDPETVYSNILRGDIALTREAAASYSGHHHEIELATARAEAADTLLREADSELARCARAAARHGEDTPTIRGLRARIAAHLEGR